jgi:hypothetical protein
MDTGILGLEGHIGIGIGNGWGAVTAGGSYSSNGGVTGGRFCL